MKPKTSPQAEKTGAICAVNYGYSGYALVRHMRAMVAQGDLGKVRLIKAEFAHGFHADAADADNPRVRWRYDPAQAGISAQFADCGIHALHMASYVANQEPGAFGRFHFQHRQPHSGGRCDGECAHGWRCCCPAMDQFGGRGQHAWPQHLRVW